MLIDDDLRTQHTEQMASTKIKVDNPVADLDGTCAERAKQTSEWMIVDVLLRLVCFVAVI